MLAQRDGETYNTSHYNKESKEGNRMTYRLVDLIKEGIEIPVYVQSVMKNLIGDVNLYGIYVLFPDDFTEPDFDLTDVAYITVENHDKGVIVLYEKD